MSEIKFRAWIKSNLKFDKRFYMVEGIELTKDGYTLPQLYGEGVDEIKYMQYTGLKDKNGREIYEGDIINWYHGDAKIDPEEYSQNYTLCVVKFGFYNEDCIARNISHNGFYGYYALEINPEFGKPQINPLSWMLKSKVVGNIYENPELMEKKNE